MDEEELIRQMEGFNPITDTGRAIKFLARYLADHNHKSDMVEAEILERVRRVAEAIDKRQELDRKARDESETIFKRVVMMFVNLKGWNK
jgi:hypothetical protein